MKASKSRPGATAPRSAPAGAAPREHSLWYKDAVVYELHVRTFHDSDGDGIGDFAGLTEKLDYLQELGITAIWLLPFYPSPLRDDGYDIANYTDVHPDCGTLRDFTVFLRAAHRRGLRVIVELVLNHTSDQHPWFQQARRARPGSAARNFYVWSDTPHVYEGARIIFEDFETSNWTWDPVAGAYYWHRFYSHQPDLNYRNPAVVRAVSRVLEFWLRLGVDGLRLDAVPYLVEAEGTSSENLAQTHDVLKGIRRRVDELFTDRMLLAEANQWPEDAVAYFGEGDEAHMAFHFPLMPRLFMGIRQEDRFPIVDVLAQTPAIPDACQWALFLRNHDELTLEMVTEEERLFMYQVYTEDPEARINLGIRRRLAPLLGNDRGKIELMNALLFSLPGTPVLYYGDEIGMGDNIFLGDRNGIRTPMQWSGDRNAGFSSADSQRLYLPLIVDYEYHHQTVHVEAQQRNRHSLLSWMKRMIALRKRCAAFGRGTLEFRHPPNRAVLAFIRRWRDEAILVVANLSRFAQYVEIDLTGFEGAVPIELMGRNPFPSVGAAPYPLTLAPYGFLWLALERAPVAGDPRDRLSSEVRLQVPDSWETLVSGKESTALEEALPDFLRSRPWFTERRRRLLSASIVDAIPIPGRTQRFVMTLVRVEYAEREPDMYTVVAGWATDARAEAIERERPGAVIARVTVTTAGHAVDGVVYDAIGEPECARALLSLLTGRGDTAGLHGQLATMRTPAFRSVKAWRAVATSADVLAEELSNSTLLYGDVAVLKLFRKVDGGAHPELAIGDFLTRRRFRHAPALLGSLEYQRRRSAPVALAVLQRFVPNDGDAWQYTLRLLRDYGRGAEDFPADGSQLSLSPSALLAASEADLPPLAHDRLQSYLPAVRRLGQRTAELHRTLGTASGQSSLAPEPFSPLYQRSSYQSLRGLACAVIEALRERLPRLPSALRPDAEAVIAAQDGLLTRLRRLLDRKLTATRIACHGNYHLQQVLCTGDDFTIIDFEGEPPRPLFQRRLKRTPLVDVVSMVRSFHYAAHVGLPDPVDAARSRFWRHRVSAEFLKSYLSAADLRLLPTDRNDLQLLFEMGMLERTLYELGFELDHRPDWVGIPLTDLREILEAR
jgi:maltose alpha-D-glucosyltransferase/alpha-amylase